MPKVVTKTRSRGGNKEYRCKCGEVIKPGQKYYTWSFRYGGTHYRHVNCGAPKRSELTQSKMATVYEAVEDAELLIDTWDAMDDTPPDRDELTDYLSTVIEVANDVAAEYREADEQFGGAGSTESAEKADELEAFAEELQTITFDDPPEKDEFEGDEDGYNDAVSEWVSECRSTAQEALTACP